MEARLQVLQDRLRAQHMTESDAKSGGPRWKSSKVEKGSIRSYGKEVSDKAKKKTMEISSGTALLSRSTTLPSKSNASVLNSQFAATINPTIAFPPPENVVQSGLSKGILLFHLLLRTFIIFIAVRQTFPTGLLTMLGIGSLTSESLNTLKPSPTMKWWGLCFLILLWKI